MTTLARGSKRQVLVLASLIMKDIRVKNSRFVFAYYVDVIEALGFVLVLSFFQSFMAHAVPIGDSTLVFIASGVLPLFFFRAISMKASSRVTLGAQPSALYPITVFDSVLAGSVVEGFTYLIVIILIMVGCYVFQVSEFAIPQNLGSFALALGTLALFAWGFACINTVIIAYVPVWKMVWSAVGRVQIFLCAIFQIPEYMPADLRNIIDLNPLAHMVALYRLGVYTGYPTGFIDYGYMLAWTGGVFIFGLALLRVYRHQLTVK